MMKETDNKAVTSAVECPATLTEKLLEIVIITYNRKREIKQTLDSLMASYSPVRRCPITILDNCSTDGASEVCEEFAARYENVKHIRHPQNIGGNANICRAFEIAKGEYIWCLSDDDGLDWSAWPEIEEAMAAGYDGIFTTLINLRRTKGLGGQIMECIFCPGCIYKRENITSNVIQGMYANIHNYVPHLTIAFAIVMNDGKFFIPKHEIVYQPPKFEDIPEIATKNNTRGNDICYAPAIEDKIWEVGFINLLTLLDEKKRNLVYSDLAILYGSQYNYIFFLIKYCISKKCNARNLFDIYLNISDEYREKFLEMLFRYFEMKEFDKIPLTLDDWNMLFITCVAKKKTNRVRSYVKRKLRGYLMWLLQKCD